MTITWHGVGSLYFRFTGENNYVGFRQRWKSSLLALAVVVVMTIRFTYPAIMHAWKAGVQRLIKCWSKIREVSSFYQLVLILPTATTTPAFNWKPLTEEEEEEEEEWEREGDIFNRKICITMKSFFCLIGTFYVWSTLLELKMYFRFEAILQNYFGFISKDFQLDLGCYPYCTLLNLY